MDTRNMFYFLLFYFSFSCVEQTEDEGTKLLSDIDIEGEHLSKYLLGTLINREPFSSSNDDIENGDQIIPTDQEENGQALGRRKIAPENTSRWPNRTIPYSFEKYRTGPENKIKAMKMIEEAIDKWESVTCLKFLLKESMDKNQLKSVYKNNYLKFINGGGCFSYVGFVSSAAGQDISIKFKGCLNHGTILHEIGHALGFFHEQNRSDRDKYLDIRLENVKDVYHANFRSFNTTNNVTYDFYSVMHYGRKFFSMNDLETLVARDQNLGFLLGNEEELSFYDIKAANFMYDCSSECDKPGILTCENDGFIDKTCNCTCPDVVEGFRCEKIISRLMKPECGSNVTILGKDDSITVKSPNYPLAFTGIECAWLVKSPPGTNITIAITLKDIPRNRRTHRCYHSIEIRYNLLGQYGPRLCGNTLHPLFLNSSSSSVMVILHAEDQNYYGESFEIEFSTGGHSRKTCFPNPCIGTKSVCVDDSRWNNLGGGYRCKCPAHLLGEDCSLIETITCNFDVPMGPNQYCLFSQSTDDQLDWRPKEGKTTSSNTGPEDDVGGSGTYLYLEASYVKTGDRAVLRSAQILGGVKCFSFYYHMYGAHIGKLMVTVTAGDKKQDWIQVGDHGNSWKRADIAIKTSENFIIEITAIRGTGWRSDTAIDSVHLTNGECSDKLEEDYKIAAYVIDLSDGVAMCPKHFIGVDCSYVSDVYCSFDDILDNGGWCVFQNDDGNDVDWVRHQGKTESLFTGPSADASSYGFYLYVETTEPAKQFDVASLATPYITGDETLISWGSLMQTKHLFVSIHIRNKGGHKCVAFMYHMFGDKQQIGSLNVSLIDEHDRVHSFISSSTHGRLWYQIYISVISVDMFKVIFTYTVGSGFRGDVAIDEFTVAHDLCTTNDHTTVYLPSKEGDYSIQESMSAHASDTN